MLEKIRGKFHKGYDELKELLEKNNDIIDSVINEVGNLYHQLDGHGKMEKAICLALGFIHIPGYVAILASDKIVDITEKVIQNRFNRLREENKI